MIKRVLIANRGEIARRIARTCRRLGIEYVAVHSDADRHSAHLAGAVEQVRIGPAAAADSYLNVGALVDAAVRTGCDAVHPGYGFLSEHPGFAAAVAGAGLVWIGPDAEMITAMGDKATARALMAAAGVPVLPGSETATESAEEILADAERIGYPVMLKPVAGGGGKGMRVVRAAADLPDAVAEAVRLGRSSFGDGRLLVERYVEHPRHLEVQVFGDRHGDVVHLYERECSLQRRHQKIVEEAPAANLSATVREELLAAAVRGARSLGYVNAGTFEFILDAEERFYFLEVNTRLQVEHPVTEEITGVDLVEWQLLVADGQRLPLAQDEITATGHAVEVRVYAEDPAHGFRPAPGRASAVRWPAGVRVEAAFDDTSSAYGGPPADGPSAGGAEPVAGTPAPFHGGAAPAFGTGADVPPFYDPMFAKLVARGPDRPAALRRLLAAVRGTALPGLTTNLGFLAELLQAPAVVAGRMDTHLVDALTAAAAAPAGLGDAEAAAPSPSAPAGRGDRVPAAAACAAAMQLPPLGEAPASPWHGAVGPFDRLRLDPLAPLGRIVLRHGGRTLDAGLLARRGATVDVQVEGSRFTVTSAAVPGHAGLVQGAVGDAHWTGLRTATGWEIAVDGHRVALAGQSFAAGAGGAADTTVTSQMPGTVVGLLCEVGDRVEEGDALVIVEAMKMENRILAPFSGVVTGIRCAVRDLVAAEQVLVELDGAPEEAVADRAA
ncbi:biotin carboxylase N-terminal domain-containing protein [Kitasatospora sp. A2-31]|uniref:ATP-binding protein n=1 Tax=Kitasatospora sp. A2-31 TaxID=2916414 RepID=UPI001EEF4972|nr:biotin carboxylase N-terminal domain-containing protein [Kitasatospora sp. A2-31]MCG6499500.1 ATP-grasp domain-containing protein [Kitasatospora sp. A2-31]